MFVYILSNPQTDNLGIFLMSVFDVVLFHLSVYMYTSYPFHGQLADKMLVGTALRESETLHLEQVLWYTEYTELT